MQIHLHSGTVIGTSDGHYLGEPINAYTVDPGYFSFSFSFEIITLTVFLQLQHSLQSLFVFKLALGYELFSCFYKFNSTLVLCLRSAGPFKSIHAHENPE